MKRILFIIVMIGLSDGALGTTYYVSSSLGNDSNSGTSSASPWQTLSHVNTQTFAPGDSVLFRRGDVWNDSLVPPSSGAAGNLILFDAYGSGPAPRFTGYYAVPSSAWVQVVGNAWKAPLPSIFTTVNFCLFGAIWGQKVSASTSNLTAQWDFYLANGYLYVFSVGNPSSYYGSVAPMALSNAPVINVNSKSWLSFQHILVNWFDDLGLYVQGTSDHLVFANMEADSMIPQGTQPLGFYVNESTPGPGDIKIYNSSAHMNYDGFRFDGSATAITMINDNGYANRDSALVDNTGAVSYGYCHFYASSLAVAGSTDVTWTSGTGPVAGAGNVAADTPAAVQTWQRYPAEITLTVDDIGMTPGADTYYASQVLPVAQAAAVPVGVAVTTGYTSTIAPIVSEIQGWINSGIDVTSHSVSHTYYTNSDALEIQYTGSGTAASLSISNKVLTITVTGASDSVSYNLAQGQPQGTIAGLKAALNGTGKFTTSYLTPCQGPYGTGCSAYTNAGLLSQDLADVTSADVKTSQYHLLLDVTRLTTDEITLSRQWMQANLTGLPATPVYVYPGGYETSTMQGITVGVPYSGARGALKEDLGVKDTYASGFDVQNITSFGVNPSWMGSGGAGVTPAQLNQKIQALVWKQKVWGVPWGVFWHLNELVQNDPVGGNEITNLISDFKNAGATIQTNTGLVNWLMTGTLAPGTGTTAGNYYYKIPALNSYGVNGGVDFRPTASSPIVDAGQNLGATYQVDINGINQNSYGSGWEIGAHAYIPQSTYGVANASSATHFWVGGGSPLQNMAQLPLNWANENEVNPPGGSYDVTKTMGVDYPLTTAGCNAAIAAWAAAPDQWWHVIIPHGQLLLQTGVCTLLGKSGATKFMVWDTDTPLTMNQTVCSHRTTDNPDGSSPRNLGCTNDVGSMGTVEGQFSPGNHGLLLDACAIGTTECTVAPNHYAFRNLELRPQAGQNQGKTYLVNLNDGDTTGLLGANHIWFVGDYFHGDATDAGGGSNLVSAAVEWTGCAYCGVVYSYVDQFASVGNEDHIMQVTWSPGPSKFFGNWFEGSSINWLTGGATVTVQPYENVYDAEIRENRFTKPAAWMTIPTSGTGSVALNLKSDFECKSCTRVLLDGNIFEYSSTNGAQKGQCITLTPRNTAGGNGGDNYGNAVTDITITNNVCRHAVAGIEAAGRSGGAGNGGGAAQPSRRWNVQNNLFYDISPGTATIFNNTVTQPFVMEVGSGGNSWTCGASRDATGLIATLTCADGGTGYHQTTMSPSDLVHVTSCSDATFNTPTRSSGNYAGEGPAALPGTVPTGLTVIYPNSGTANASTTGCVLTNEQGFPQAYTFRHNSVFGAFVGSVGGAGVLPSCLNIDSYAQSSTFQDNLIALPGSYSGTLCQGDGNTEGTKSEVDMFDPPTLTFNFNGFAGRSAGSYTDYPGAWNPPIENWFPANVSCTGATANSSCFGFGGMMNGAAYEANAANYHDYELVSSSLFKAGGTWQADDGTDIGAQIPIIDAAQTRFVYSCAVACGVGSVAKPPQMQILAPGPASSVSAVNTYLKASPYINAIVYTLWWACSDQDGTVAHYSWTNFDNQVLSDGWAAAGKKIIVVLGGVTYGGTDTVCYGGNGWGTTGVGNYATPAYVWTALGATNYVTCSGNGGSQQIPNYLNGAYLTHYQNWVAATLTHLATASYGSAVEYVRVAWGKGGETTPFSSWDAVGTCPDANGNNKLTTDWGYTLAGWESFLQNGMTFEAGLGSPLQLMISITPMGPSGGSQAAVPNFTAPIAASLHIGFGLQGLMASDVNNFYGCGGNWCQLFATYSGQVPLETQTFYQSCAATNESGSCPSMALTTGTLDPLLSWAALNHVTSFEMYYEDACSMLCPGYNVSGYAAYPQAGYLAAMANAVGGNF